VLATKKYQIAVDLPTAKKYVEVAGLGLFENGKTTELTDEQVELWFLRPRSAGSDPMIVFQDGIEITEVSRSSEDEAKSAPEAKESADGESSADDAGEGDAK
jgi:hypothetical protein